jgi:hypothetical protein
LQLIGLTEGLVLQPILEVATLIGLMEGRGFKLYERLQLTGLTEGLGLQPTYMGGCNTNRVNGLAGLQPIWEVATDGVYGGVWTSTYMGSCNWQGLRRGLDFKLYRRLQLLGFTEGFGLQTIQEVATLIG